MLFRLALALGYPHPRYLQPLLTSQDLTDWHAYSLLEPFGGAREDYRAGTLAALAYNVNRDTKKDRDGKRWFDFFANVYGGLEEEAAPVDADDETLNEVAWKLLESTFNRKNPTKE